MLRPSSADDAEPTTPATGLPLLEGADAVARALGHAWAVGRQRRLPGRLRRELTVPDTEVALALIEASDLPRSLTALAAACVASERGYDVPLVVVVAEDGSAALPTGWVRRALAGQPGLAVVTSDEDADLAEAAATAEALARREGAPVAWHVHGKAQDAAAAIGRRGTPAPRPDDTTVGDAQLTEERRRAFGGVLPEDGEPLTFADTMEQALLDAGVGRPRLVVLSAEGEAMPSAARRRLGSSRVVEVPVDGSALVEVARGAAETGLLPVVRVGDAAILSGAVAALVSGAPVLVRAVVPSRSDAEVTAAVSALSRVPGAVVACPAHPVDAPGALHRSLDAVEEGRPVLLLEPREGQMRDLLTDGDGAWTAPYVRPGVDGAVALGRAAVWGTGEDVTVAALASGVPLAVRTASTLQGEGVACRVVDLRWRRPLPLNDVIREAEATGRLVVVEHGPESAGLSEELVTACLEAGFGGRLTRVTPATRSNGTRIPVTQEALESAVRSLLTN